MTVLGWANVLQGTLYFLFPAIGMKSTGRVRMERAHEFVIAGGVHPKKGSGVTISKSC